MPHNNLMKKILFVFTFCICACNIKAQYVTIPDSGFRIQLQNIVPGCFNSNGMLDTTCSELSTVTSISVGIYAIDDPAIDIDGIQYFKSLQSFLGNTLSSIYNISLLPNTVKSITLEETYPVNWTRYPDSLTTLYILAGDISELPQPLPESLVEFDFVTSFQQSLLPLPSKLQILNVWSNDLRSLPSLPPSLQQLDCSENSNLNCLPELPAGLKTLNIDTTIRCLPNVVNGLTISMNGKSSLIPPVCSATDNPNGCTLYKVCIWNGRVSTQWENAANWDCGYVPDAGTDAVVDSGNVVVHSNVTIKSLSLNPAAHLLIDSNYSFTVLQ